MSSFVDIYINEREKNIPHKCEICEGILQTLEDTVSAYNNGACCDCFVCFIEPNKNVNGDSWKPSKKEINDWLLKKRKQYNPRYKFF